MGSSRVEGEQRLEARRPLNVIPQTTPVGNLSRLITGNDPPLLNLLEHYREIPETPARVSIDEGDQEGRARVLKRYQVIHQKIVIYLLHLTGCTPDQGCLLYQ